MAQWGRNDQAPTVNSSTTHASSNGSPIGLYPRALVSGQSTVSMAANAAFGNSSSGSAAAIDLELYGNTTIGQFINNMAIGIFGVNASIMAAGGGGNVVSGHMTFDGTGYQANATVTVLVNTGTVASAHVNTTSQGGHIDGLLVSNVGNFWPTPPAAVIAAPSAQSVTANTASITANTFIAIATANSLFIANDAVTYVVPTSNTAVPPLVNNTVYWIAFSNTTGVKLSLTQGGANIANLNPPTTNPAEVHHLQGATATGHFVMNTEYGNVASGVVDYPGSGYAANAAVTVNPTSGGNSAAVNSTVNTSSLGGHITTLTMHANGAGYVTAPAIAISAPTAFNVDANTTGVTGNSILMSTANTFWVVGDEFFYGVPTGNVAIGGLTGNTYYFVQSANTTGITVATTAGGAQTALAAPTVGSGATVTAHANVSVQGGWIDALNISAAGTLYSFPPSLAIAAPATQNVLANTVTIVGNTFLTVTTANSFWQANDGIFYGVPSSNTAIPPLVGNTGYFVAFANTTGLILSATPGGANIANLNPPTTNPAETHHLTGNTATGTVTANSSGNLATPVVTFHGSGYNANAAVTLTQNGHTIEVHTVTGMTATGYVDINSTGDGIAHAGWVLRTEGSGGRAGRVQYETLVAMGSLGAQSAAYGTPAVVSSNAAIDNLV